MQVAGVLDFITGAEPSFRRPDVRIQPGDKFGCYEGANGWLYVDVLGHEELVPKGCVYGRAFTAAAPEGREGYCRRSQLDLRIDNRAWDVIRENGWQEPGCALRLERPAPRPATPVPHEPTLAAPPAAARESLWLERLLAVIPRWLLPAR